MDNETANRKLSQEAQQILYNAKVRSQELSWDRIGVAHILYGLLVDTRTARLFNCFSMKASELSADLNKEGYASRGPGPVGKHLDYTSEVEHLIELAGQEAESMNQQIDGGHLLLGILRLVNHGIAQVLVRHGLKLESVRTECLKLRDPNLKGEAAKPARADTECLERDARTKSFEHLLAVNRDVYNDTALCVAIEKLQGQFIEDYVVNSDDYDKLSDEAAFNMLRAINGLSAEVAIVAIQLVFGQNNLRPIEELQKQLDKSEPDSREEEWLASVICGLTKQPAQRTTVKMFDRVTEMAERIAAYQAQPSK